MSIELSTPLVPIPSTQEKRGRLYRMMEKRKFCLYLDEYINTRPLDGYTAEIHKVLRVGIRFSDEQSSFIRFLQAKPGFKDKPQEELLDLIADSLREDFLEKQSIAANGTSYVLELLRLGYKGRKLTRKSRLSQWAYVFQFAYGDRGYFYTFIIGGGLGLTINYAVRLIRWISHFHPHIRIS